MKNIYLATTLQGKDAGPGGGGGGAGEANKALFLEKVRQSNAACCTVLYCTVLYCTVL